MRFNLEKLKEAARADEECFDNSNIWAALEGFEAELREIITRYEKRNITEIGIEDLKEILGQ